MHAYLEKEKNETRKQKNRQITSKTQVRHTQCGTILQQRKFITGHIK